MSQALCFQSVEFDVIQQNQQPWVRGIQIGYALEYQNPAQAIAKLYDSHADEFTPAMTAVVTLPTEGGPQETRIFSLRGCHLLAMFARTPVAKAFRRWVLDVIERYGDQVPVAHPVTLNDSSMTPEQQARLHAVVDAKVSMVPKPYRRHAYKEIWTRFNRHFQIARYVQLPAEKIEDGVEYLLAMQVNAGKAQALEQGAFSQAGADSVPFRNTFPVCLTITEAECERLIHEIEEAHVSIMEQVERLCHKAGRIALRLGQECQFRANMGDLRGKEGETLADSLYSYTTHMVVHAIFCPYGERPLPTFQNPGYYLLGICRQLRGRA